MAERESGASLLWRFDRALALGLAMVVASMLASGGVAYWNTRQLRTNAYWVAHTEEVLDSLDDLLSTMKDAETGQRGFIITGDEGYLRPYEQALADVEGKLERVTRLAQDDPGPQRHIPRLRELTRTKLDELRQTVALRKGPGFAAAREEVLTHLGKNRMDALRAEVAQMKDAEQASLRERRQANDRAYRIALLSGAFAVLLGLGAAGGFTWILVRHLGARQRAATNLYQQREWFRTTLASIGDAVITTDGDGTVTFLNAVAESLTGWSRAEAEGRPLGTVFRIVDEDTRLAAADPAHRVLQTGAVTGLANHTLLIAREGTERPIDDSAAPLRDEGGHIFGVVLVFRDISERRAGEKVLREADRRKDEFLAILAHELRSPLAPIRIAVDLLRRAQDDGALMEQARQIMERQVGQLVRLVDDLLDVSRITQGRVHLRKERVDLAEVIAHAVEAARPLVDGSGHELTVQLPPEPIHLEADPARITQVLVNLLSNAAKYTNAGGSIVLNAERRDGEAVVRVQDTGIGITAEQLPHVFDMFSQAEPALERSHGGLGIGLSLVRGLVQLHGGSVEAQSNGSGAGSTFIVRLPVVEVPAGSSPASLPVAAGPPGSPRVRILVVDDHTDTLESMATILRLMGHEVRTAEDGRQAVEVCEEQWPDVAFVDIGLPVMNGYEVARHIRGLSRDKTLTLIALTGWGQDEDKRRALAAGFDHHLTKPVHPDALTALLSQVRRLVG